MNELTMIIMLIIVCFTITILVALKNGQAVECVKISLIKLFVIEAKMNKGKEKAGVASTDLKQKK